MSYKAILVALWDKVRIVLMPHWVKSWIMTLMHIPFFSCCFFFLKRDFFTNCTNPKILIKDFKFGEK